MSIVFSIMESTDTNPETNNNTSNMYCPKKIAVEQLVEWKDRSVKSIDGLVIPHITVPPHLVSKKRATEAIETITINIRQLFNSLTTENISQVKQQLKDTILEKAKNEQCIKDIAQEILSNFLISEVNIKNYMHLLNAISPICILVSNGSGKNVSPSIGNMFLMYCRDLILDYVQLANVKKLALYDLDDMDQVDIYNRERTKIINLIITICYLYEQRHTANLKLTALQLVPLIKTLLNNYQILQNKMKELGNPYEEDCADEEEYENCTRMCTIYAEQIYEFIYRELEEFKTDDTRINTNETLQTVVERFRTEVIPTLSQAYLRSKCNDLNF